MSEKHLRVLSVIHGPAFGGAHNQAKVLLEPLRRRGIETLVVLPDEASRAAALLRDSEVPVVTVPLHRLRASIDPRTQWGFVGSIRNEVRRLAALIEREEIDVVQSHGVTNPHGALAARRAGVASLWQIFDTRAPMLLRRLTMPGVLALTDASTVWGRQLAEVHPGLTGLGSRLTVVFPPVEPERFRPDPAIRAEARRELGIADGELLVGSVGVLNPQKGHEFTIRAAELVHRAHPDARFRILGTDSPAHARYKARLRSEIAERKLTDIIDMRDPGAEVARLIQAFDLFLMTSVPRSEGMPTVILEAMTCAKAVVATRVGAVDELVEHEETGLVVSPCDVGEIAAAISALLGDPARRELFGERARARAQGRFSLERLADLHAGAYESALRHRATRT